MPWPPFAPDPSVRPEAEGFLDAAASTITEIVRDPAPDACAVIDPVMDIDDAAGRIAHDGADRSTDCSRTATPTRSAP